VRLGVSIWGSGGFRKCTITASGLGLVAVRVGVGMCFCTVPISGDKLAFTIKLSRWLCPDKRRGLLQVQKLADGDAKTMTTVRRPTAP
jgi:hypothetical protein